jgi:DREV methyltransferase
MFILSESQFSQLLLAGGFNPNNFKSNTMIDMLDIGAGDGEVTVRLARSIMQTGQNILLKVYTTETSWIMKDRLQEKNFT